MGARSNLLYRFFDVWRRDASLSTLLGLLAFMIFVVAPLRGDGIVNALTLDVGFGMLVIVGALAMTERPLIAWTSAALALVAIMLTGILKGLHLQIPLIASYLVLMRDVVEEVYLVLLAWAILHQVLRSGYVNAHRIAGAVTVYLLLGLIWAQTYVLIEAFSPGSFTPMPSYHGIEWTSFLYFSFVTLTTVGYGDITAITPIARSLAIAEAIAGHLFSIILITRLVSLELESRSVRN